MLNKFSEIKEAKEAFQVLMELSRMLSLGLDQDILSICVRMCEAGINPELLARVVKELQKATAENVYNEQ